MSFYRLELHQVDIIPTNIQACVVSHSKQFTLRKIWAVHTTSMLMPALE